MTAQPVDVPSGETAPDGAPPEATAPPWHLVEVPDAGDCRVTTFSDVQAVCRRLIELEGQDVICFVFQGFRAGFTKKPFRRLVLPDGGTLPLFAEPEIGELEESGYLGEEEVQITPPPTREEEQAEYDVVQEFEDDVPADAAPPPEETDDE